MSDTIVVQIGNTDDKLSQKEWSEFIDRMEFAIRRSSETVHFCGGPDTGMPWQNYCWIFTLWSSFSIRRLEEDLTEIRKRYKQDSIAVIVGKTEFI